MDGAKHIHHVWTFTVLLFLLSLPRRYSLLQSKQTNNFSPFDGHIVGYLVDSSSSESLNVRAQPVLHLLCSITAFPAVVRHRSPNIHSAFD